MKLDWVKQVVSDGRHNAFTDLAAFQGRYYLAFRCGQGHADDIAEQVILQSDDGQTWREQHRIHFPPETPGTTFDYRDSHFLTEPDRLSLYSFATVVRPDTHERFASYTFRQWTRDGKHWSAPEAVCREATLWRALRTKDAFWSAGYRAQSPGHHYRVDLYRSEDGIAWETAAPIAAEGSETALHQVSADELLAVVRSEAAPYHLAFFRSHKPYQVWRQTAVIPKIIQSPHVIAWQGGLWLLGRERPDYRDTANSQAPSFGKHRTKIWRITGDAIEEALELPSKGDTAYTGTVVCPDGSLLISYYSQHARGGDSWQPEIGADIYVARVTHNHPARFSSRTK